MAYTPEQRKVAKAIVRIGRKRGESKRKINANLATGIVESNLTNIVGGDADSSGYRQERASLYANPNNLKAAINRFYDEADQLDRGQGAGQLAADVQRPAAQYRGRYGERLDQAKQLRRSITGQAAGGGGGGKRSGSVKTSYTPASASVDLSNLERDAKLAYLQNRDDPNALLELGSSLGGIDRAAKSLQVSGGTKTTSTSRQSGPKRAQAPAGGKNLPQHREPKNLLEMFWQGAGGINVKHGQRQPQGFVDGHEDHVHVAANPKAVVKLGKLAQDMGLTVRENKHFDPVDPVHTSGSYHYSNRAIDVSGDATAMRKYAHKVAKLYGV